jgi:hypothetical protein
MGAYLLLGRRVEFSGGAIDCTGIGPTLSDKLGCGLCTHQPCGALLACFSVTTEHGTGADKNAVPESVGRTSLTQSSVLNLPLRVISIFEPAYCKLRGRYERKHSDDNGTTHIRSVTANQAPPPLRSPCQLSETNDYPMTGTEDNESVVYEKTHVCETMNGVP